MSSLQLIKCKICGSIIKEPELIIGEDQNTREAKVVQVILAHLNESLLKESANHHPTKPHVAAYTQQIAPSLSTSATYVSLAAFDLPDWISAIRDRLKQTIHQGTRSLRMSDADLDKLFISIESDTEEAIFGVLRDLRDRYEGLGKYAPATPATNAPAAQEAAHIEGK